MWSRKPKKVQINPALNICVVKTDKDGNKSWLYGKNQVTNDGDIYYATRAGTAPSVQTAPDPNFFDAACVLQNPSSADTIAKTDTYAQVSNPIVTSGAVKDVEAGFPKVNDTTTENTGKDVDAVTYKFTWTTSQIDTSSGNPITGGCIIDSGDATGDTVSASAKILTHWNFVSPSSFHKTNTDTLTLYVNHTMSGQA
jgi:hypothetical protein